MGYDPADPVRDRPVPYKLMRDLQAAPLLSRREIGRVSSMRMARMVALRRLRMLHSQHE